MKTGFTVKKRNKIKVFKKSYQLTLMSLPAIILFIIFNYVPMFGIILAFKKLKFNLGFFKSPWVGLDNFKFFFQSQDAWTITRNTIGLNALFIVAGLVVSVAFAILLNEISKRVFVKTYQTAMFFPYFLSWVVVGYMLYAVLNDRLGILNQVLEIFGMEPVSWYSNPQYWPVILLIVYLWKNVGYLSVIYYAGIMGIDNALIEAAIVDGANKFQVIKSIILPMLVPIITVMTLLQIGRIFYADFGMFYYLPNDVGALYPTTQVIDTYVYRALRVTGQVGMATAAGFFQAVVGLCMVLTSNFIVKKYNKDNAIF
ncbi:ABC transporter permease [Vallitalea guaymasensis]|uniref:ABC transporter permease n=1 Tax=Vallitalea guaymasensis TaxID=1185412 RepID=UPI00272DA604|nr:ABC transporter permease subunit [Vallitalea guaymasensis]